MYKRQVYECEYTVDSRDIDPWYHCRPSGLMGMLQEAATQAACALHVSRDEMLERYNSFWMLARLWYRLDVPLSWGDTVHIRTWHRGGRGASTYRDFDLFVNGQPVGEAVSTWVLADAATHKLARMGRIDVYKRQLRANSFFDIFTSFIFSETGIRSPLTEERTIN